RELKNIDHIVAEETRNIEKILKLQMNEKLMAVKRMGQRWESAGGTPAQQRRRDSDNYINHIVGLQKLMWIDSEYNIRLSEPELQDGGAHTALSPEDRAILEQAATSGQMTVSAPVMQNDG